MCGLAGYIRLNTKSNPASVVRNTFVNLFLTSQLRGFHSSGAAAMWVQHPKNGYFKRKKCKPRYGWITSKDTNSPFNVYCDVMQDMKNRTEKNKDSHEESFPIVILGHSRHATIGEITQDNAHPFSFFNNRFIGVHNGTIHNAHTVYNKLVEEEEPLADTLDPIGDYTDDGEATDSEIVLYSIYRWGIDKVYPHISGAWALVWYDQRTQSIYFVRNSQRSLYYYWSIRYDAFFWSSERDMLEFGCRRELKEFAPDQVGYFKPHILYRIDMRKVNNLPYTTTELPWATPPLDLEPLLPRASVVSYSGGSPYYYGAHSYDDDKDYDDYSIAGDRHTPKKQDRKVLMLPPKPGMKQGKTFHNGGTSHRALLRPVSATFCVPPYEEDDGDGDESVETSRINSHCLNCGAELEDPNSNANIKVPSHGLDKGGTVCLDCSMDWFTVDQIIENYPHLSDNTEWVQLAMFLENEANNKQKGVSDA